ncbi:isochorismatase family protein [Actinomadura sp. LD22]|uniref:Isochorismatase family protein n=1 Tax=Actinomadura physcomitrii TaxID=2650748 RepID=A0A6I4M786_9ACTN|nr:isochorismatase family cysteine hydrolase [Actinomadura physcomitrii]MWA01633.1 isochorismatase family protein [Actinomadura physcomitrii]
MTTAVLVIDMQNGFCHPKGSLPSHHIVLPRINEVVAQNVALLEEARSVGLPIVYTRHVFRPDYVEAQPRVRARLPMDARPLVRGSWDAEIIDELAPRPADHVIDKSRFDAFLYTELETVLRGMQVRRLLVSGILTSVCVESTVRSGQQRDFDMLVAADCCSAPERFHAPALEVMAEVFAEVGQWRALLKNVL